MPAKSKAQQRFFGMVRAVQKGEIKPSEVGDEVTKAAKSMTKKDVKDFASTKTKKLPEKVKENITMRRNSISETIREINNLSRMLKEAYIYDEDEPEMDYDPRGEEMPEEEGIPEEEEMANDPKTESIVDEIRQLALRGIQKYADDVDNEMYQLFKKVWMMCDKCLSEKDKVEN